MIDWDDLELLIGNMGASLPAAPAGVPERAALYLLTLVSVALICRRGRGGPLRRTAVLPKDRGRR